MLSQNIKYYHCCFDKCTTKFDTKPKLSLFKLPEDKQLRDAWLAVIAKVDGLTSEEIHVCELHFKPSDLLTNGKSKRLKEGAIPLKYVKSKGKRDHSYARFVPAKSNERPKIIGNIPQNEAMLLDSASVDLAADPLNFEQETTGNSMDFYDSLMLGYALQVDPSWAIHRNYDHILLSRMFVDKGKPCMEKQIIFSRNYDLRFFVTQTKVPFPHQKIGSVHDLEKVVQDFLYCKLCSGVKFKSDHAFQNYIYKEQEKVWRHTQCKYMLSNDNNVCDKCKLIVKRIKTKSDKPSTTVVDVENVDVEAPDTQEYVTEEIVLSD